MAEEKDGKQAYLFLIFLWTKTNAYAEKDIDREQ